MLAEEPGEPLWVEDKILFLEVTFFCLTDVPGLTERSDKKEQKINT